MVLKISKLVLGKRIGRGKGKGREKEAESLPLPLPLPLPHRWSGKTKLLVILLVLLFLSLSWTTLAGVEVLFSPGDNINYRIIEAVNLSEECIDVAAAFDFTSREIAEALVSAKRKGLGIRLLVDKKLIEDNNSQIKFLEEKGFDVKALKGKGEGSMKNAFLIFDGRLVIVGPYHLTKDSESYNYENAIFFDDPEIVETYQNEFDKLFGTRSILKTASKKAVKDSLLSTIVKPSFESGGRSQESGVLTPNSEPQPAPVEQPEVKIATSESGVKELESRESKVETPNSELRTQDSGALPAAPTALPGSFIDISFEELDKIFGKESTLSEAEKNALWPNYMSRYVRWTGEVTYTLLGLVKGTRIGFRHKSASGESNTDVEVRFSIKKATKIMKVTEGSTITYTAKLFSLPTSDTPYYVLNEGTLE